mmetsp:Transcript_6052/g.15505  ORF Transcript_6052/g.15505 Transcript_6052/m.15505 type:complete len:225 (+) Transcript_6052:632-1306(+)
MMSSIMKRKKATVVTMLTETAESRSPAMASMSETKSAYIVSTVKKSEKAWCCTTFRHLLFVWFSTSSAPVPLMPSLDSPLVSALASALATSCLTVANDELLALFERTEGCCVCSFSRSSSSTRGNSLPRICSNFLPRAGSTSSWLSCLEGSAGEPSSSDTPSSPDSSIRSSRGLPALSGSGNVAWRFPGRRLCTGGEARGGRGISSPPPGSPSGRTHSAAAAMT